DSPYLPHPSACISRNRLAYNATIEPLDFNAPQALSIINDWVSNKTNGRIQKVIDTIDSDLMMLLLNAIYFKGDWTTEFDPAETRPDHFFLADSSQTSCRMMQLTETLPYFENELFQAVDLPYGDGPFAMAVFLPRTSLDDLISRLDNTAWEEWHARFNRQKGTLQLPKFKLSCEVIMKNALKAMGMAVAFDDQRADFSGISTMMPLFISYVKHCSFVQVDEVGTEAAAVTVVGVGTTSIGGPGGFFMRIDRPFLVVIHDHHSRTALFIGRIYRPEWD
ncbi:MAG TPA: serpin family protein, partial [bacterium]|nr:serpin family protein [bacterium]